MSEMDPTEFVRKGGDAMAGPLTLHGLASEPFEAMPYAQLSSHLGGTPPPGQTENPVLEDVAVVTILGGLKSLVVIWTSTPAVHGHGFYKVDIATDINFTNDLQSEETKGTIIGFDGLVTGNTYYARVTPISADGTIGNSTVSNPVILGGASGADIENAAIDTVHIGEQVITAPKILAGTITANEIMASTITGDRIAANTILGNNIAGNTITGTNIVVGVELTSPTITGGLIRTAASGPRVEITSADAKIISFYRDSGTLVGSMGWNGVSAALRLTSPNFVELYGTRVFMSVDNYNEVQINGATVYNSGNLPRSGTTGGTTGYTDGADQFNSGDTDAHSHTIFHGHPVQSHTHAFSF